MKTSKRIAAALMSAVMAVGMIPAALAADVDADSGVGSVPVALSQSATTFSVTIPTTLPIAMTAEHAISTATDAQLVNNSYGPIQVKAVAVNEQNGWNLVSYDTDFRKVKVNAKQFGMELQGVAVDPSGEADDSAFLSIDGRKSLPLTYDAVVAAQSAAISDTVANVVFTIGWDEGAMMPSEPEVQYEDFEVTSSNRAAVGYTGASGENLVIPATFVGDGSNGTEAGVNYRVTSIGEKAFERCTKLTSVDIPSSVSSIGDGAFNGCTSLTSVDIPNNVTSIGILAFAGTRKLTSVTIPESVTSIGVKAFASCTELTLISVDKEEGTLDGSPWGATNAAIVYKGDFAVTKTNRAAFGYTGASGENLVIPSTIVGDGNNGTEAGSSYNVTTIGKYAFQNCTGLTSVTIPEGVTSIGNCAFMGCTGLTSVIIPESVTSMGSQIFSKCTGLTSVDIPGSVTSIGSSAFSGCTGLTSVTIPEGVTTIGDYAFMGCTGLTSVIIPESVTSIGTGVFSGCTELTSIAVASGNTVYDSRNDCNAVIETATNTLIQGCNTAVISGDVTSIGDYAFDRLTGLTCVDIPSSVISIGRHAFQGCTGLTNIYYDGTKAEWDAIAKDTEWDNNTSNYTLHCSDYNTTAIISETKTIDGKTVVIDNIREPLANEAIELYTAMPQDFKTAITTLTFTDDLGKYNSKFSDSIWTGFTSLGSENNSYVKVTSFVSKYTLYHEAAHAYDHYNNGCTSTAVYSGSAEWNTIHTNEEAQLKTWYNSSAYAALNATEQKAETFCIAISKYFTDQTWLQTNCPQAYAYIQGLNIQ